MMLQFTVGFVVSACLVPFVILLLRTLRVMDEPNHRSSHALATPRGGGLAVMVGTVASLALDLDGLNVTLASVLGGAVTLGAVGFADDIRSLDARLRLALQLVVAVGVTWFVTREHGLLAAVAVACLLLAYTNAFNFMDGINGISALHAIVGGLWIALMGYHGATDWLSPLGIGLASAAAGFLPWNLSGRVFLGDVGSYFLGFALAGGLAAAVSSGASWPQTLSVLTIYGVDTAWATAKRLKRGDSWRAAHREHVYQRLADRGGSHLMVALLTVCATAGCALVSLMPLAWPLQVMLIAALSVTYLCLPRLLGRYPTPTRIGLP